MVKSNRGWLRGRRRHESALEQALRELAEAHAELARRQSFTDALLETVEVGIVSCDATGRFVVSNRTERAMFGLESGLDGLFPEHLPALIDVLSADGRPLDPVEYPLMRALRGESVKAFDVLVGPVGFPHREVVVTASQILGQAGELLGAVAALSDVTTERTASRALAEERRKLTEAQRLGQLGSFECDFRADTWTFSDPLCEVWGLSPDRCSADLFLALVHEQDRQHFADSWRAAVEGDDSRSYSYRIHRANDGAERLLRTRVEVELGTDGRPTYGRGTTLDITDLAAAEREAQLATAFFHAILTASPDYTQVTDLATGAVIYGSPGKDLLGVAPAELQARGPGALQRLIHPMDQQAVRDLHEACAGLADGRSLQARYRASHADGGWRWLNQCVTPFRRDDSGTVIEVLAVLRDVTDVVHAEERLTYAARHDVLTGLPNRTMLVEALDRALRTSARDGGEVAVLFCDLDGFKLVNDTGGHSAGDAVLFEAARRLRDVVRPEDTVARVGGDEFVILVEPWKGELPESGGRLPGRQLERSVAVQVAERVGEALRLPISVKGIAHTVTASIGITFATFDGLTDPLTADEVLHQADAAMYRAKDRGKNRYELSDGADRPDLARHP